MRDSARAEQIENARCTSRIELGERIIEQDERTAPRATKCRRFQKTKRNRRCTLLSRRAERSQLMAVERKLEIVSMGTNMREPTPYIDTPMRLE